MNIENIHCGYTEYEGRYVITNSGQLDKFTSTTAIDISQYDWAGIFKSNSYVFFVEIVIVSNNGYDLKKSGIMCKGGTFEFISSPESKALELDEQYSEVVDGSVLLLNFQSKQHCNIRMNRMEHTVALMR